MNRSKLKEVLRPIVTEALSDYIRDSEEDIRQLQSERPHLDMTKMPTPVEDVPVREVKSPTIVDFSKWWKYTPRQIMSTAYWLKRQIPPIDEKKYAENWKKLRAQLMLKYKPPSGVKLPDLNEASTTNGNPDMGYQTPFAFSKESLKTDAKKRTIAQQLGYKLVRENRVRDEEKFNLAKTVPLTEGYSPKLTTTVAHVIYNKMLDYLLLADDPQYERIRQFRAFIERKVTSPQDKQELIKFFNDEFHPSHGTAWEYYK